MKKFINKFLAVAVSLVTAIAMVALGSGSVAYAETSEITNNVKYFSTTMYNYNKTQINQAAGTTDKTNNFYFINENADTTWAEDGTINYCYKTENNSLEAYNVLVQGIVQNELDSSGQIKFNYDNAGIFAPAKTTVSGRTVYQNVYDYSKIIKHGVLYIRQSNLGNKELTVYTPGRTRVNFGTYKEDGSFIYRFNPYDKDALYTARTFIQYKDANGKTCYEYSDMVSGSVFGIQ